MEKIELVCFDLGGVLVRLVRGWEHAVKVAGVKAPAGEVDWGRHHELAVALEVGAVSEEEYERGIRECMPGVECGAYWRVFDAWLMGLYPGVPELIGEIKARGVRTAVLSNTNVRHWRVLTTGEYAPLNEVDYLLASHLMRCRKPDVEAYRWVERESGAEPGRILFFDDKAENVEAARAAGWRAEVIDPTREGVGQCREFLRKHGVI